MTTRVISFIAVCNLIPSEIKAKNCWQNYVDYFKCTKAKGEDFVPCQQFKRAYLALCPTKWTEKWDEQREENVFPALRETEEKHH
jgi:cytochrome c oxidase subunit 6b